MAFDFDAVADLLRCPACRSELVLDGDGLLCVDAECRRRYPLRDDIPCLLCDEAEQVPPEAWSAAMIRRGRDPAG